MTAETTTRPRSVREYQNAALQIMSGAGLWTAIIVFVLWSFIQERDALTTGVIIGTVYALGALGVTLIYGVLKFGHFAHGDSMMLAAYVSFLALTGGVANDRQTETVHALPVNLGDLPGATDKIWQFSFGYGLILSIVAASVVMAGLLMLLDRLVYGRLRKNRSSIVIFSIASLGLALVLRSLMLIIWGSDPRFYSQGLREAVDLPLGIRVLYDQIFIFFAALVMAAATYVLLYWTKLGKAMRAMADNADLARISGINTERIVLWTWAVAGVLIAVAGVMLGMQQQLKPEIGFLVLLALFAAAILGGIGSPHGALVGGLIIGIVQEVAVTFDFLAPGYKFPIAAVVLIVILLVRPRGLFGAPQ